MSSRPRLRAPIGPRDANHGEVSGYYESHMCLVADTSNVGSGFGDIVVRIPTRRGSVLQIVEIKTDDGRMEPKQERFQAEWGVASVACVRTAQDVANHVRTIQEKNR